VGHFGPKFPGATPWSKRLMFGDWDMDLRSKDKKTVVEDKDL